MTATRPDTQLFSTHPDAMGYTAGHQVQPLIGGQQTYAAIERAIAEARETVHMAYWTLDPALETPAGKYGERLRDLLRGTIQRGVKLRIVIADFDPVIGAAFHLKTWSSYRQLVAIADGLDAEAAARLSVMCSRHDTRWGAIARTAAQPILRYKLAQKVAAMNGLGTEEERRTRLQHAPGLWPFVRFENGKASVRPLAFPGFLPAAHHEKLCVIDDRTVFLGGLDIDAKRQDDWSHDNAFPWHDVACRLEGPVAHFFARHFRSRWNEERPDSLDFLHNAHPPEGVKGLPEGNDIPALPTDIEDFTETAGDIEVRPLRTLSKQGRSRFSRSPATQITEIKSAYLDVINQAQDFLYIENQFIRSTDIAEALAARARDNNSLELILLLPLIPQDAFIEDEPNMATRHGQYLRNKNTNLLQAAFHDRIGIFSMQRPSAANLPDPETTDPDDIIHNTVYIHAKTLVCDDRIAIIGSANLNGRSLVTDTETAIAWRGGDSVRDYRVELWRHALHLDTADWTSGHLAKWQTIARANAQGGPQTHKGFIVPFPRRHLDAHAKRSWLVPDELV